MPYTIAPAFIGKVSLLVHGSEKKDLVSGLELIDEGTGAVIMGTDADGAYIQAGADSGMVSPVNNARHSRDSGATWVAVFKRGTTHTPQALLGVHNGTPYEWFAIDVDRNLGAKAGCIAVAVRDAASNATAANSGVESIADNELVKVVFQRTKTTGLWSAWIDGVLQTDFSANAGTAAPSGSNSVPFGILQRNLHGTSRDHRGAAKLYLLARIDTSEVNAASLSVDPFQLVSPEGGATIPAAPTMRPVSDITSTGFTVNWIDEAADETGYKVQIAASPYSTWVDASGSPTGANASSLEIVGLTASTAYKCRVASFNLIGTSAWVETPPVATAAALGTRGVRLQLHNGAVVQDSVADIDALWWDSEAPENFLAPDMAAKVGTDESGWLTLNLEAHTALGAEGVGFLLLHKAGASAQADVSFAARVAVEVIG